MTGPDDIDPAEALRNVTREFEVTWDASPPAGIGFQVHKFTILDAIERCSADLRTDPSRERETISAGYHAARILCVLPQFINQNPDKNGLLPRHGDQVILGEIGRRTVLLDMDKRMDYQIRLENGRPPAAWIVITNFT